MSVDAIASTENSHRKPLTSFSIFAKIANLLSLIFSIYGFKTGLAGINHHFFSVSLPWLAPPFGISFHSDQLGSFFTLIIASIAVCVSIFNCGYIRVSSFSAISIATFPIFIATLELIPLASTVPTFLILWEMMSLESILLVLNHIERPNAQRAALLYAVLSQLSFFSILAFFAVITNPFDNATFSAIGRHASLLTPDTRNWAFILAFIGFGTKAGLVPLHAWLPKAHPEAPAPASALMSTAMVSLGIYGLVKFVSVYLRGGPQWWGLLLVAVGAISAVYCVMQSSSSSDLKVLLAYSTSENMGIIAMAVGTEVLMTALHQTYLVFASTLATLILVASHAIFKALAFLATGVIAHVTGTTDLDSLGGLAKKLRFSTAAFGIAAISSSGLPFGAAFIGEWILLQTLIHIGPTRGLAALAAPLAIGAIALTSGIGIMAMVKAFGIGFLGRARSDLGELKLENFRAMQFGMGLLAVGNILIGFFPSSLTSISANIVHGLGNGSFGPTTQGTSETLGFDTLGGIILPIGSAAILIASLLLTTIIPTIVGKSHPESRTVEPWACGARELSPAMQYNASSFAEPLERVFSDVLRPHRDVETETFEESRLIMSRIQFRNTQQDAIESALYNRVIAAISQTAQIIRLFHNGSLRRYLAFGAVGLLAMVVFLS